MAKLKKKSRRPSKSWVGRRLTASQRMSVPVLSGADDATAEVLNGQELEVIEVQSDGWLKCRFRQDMFFRGDGLRRVHANDLTVGVHVEHDLDKFQVQSRRRLREDAQRSIVTAAQEWLETKSAIDELSQELAQMTSLNSEVDQKVRSMTLELRDHRERVDKAYLALQQQIALRGEPEWFLSALELLQGLSRDLSGRASRFKQEIRQYWSKGMREQRELVQTYSWLDSFTRRLRSWLRRIEKRITELEGLVFYS